MDFNSKFLESDLHQIDASLSVRDEKPAKKWNFVQRYLSSAFSRLGYSIGKNPVPYCVVPVIVTIILCIGFYWIHLTKGFEYLFAPTNGRYIRERDAIETLFPPSSDGVTILTATRLRGTCTVLIEPKSSDTILRETFLEEALRIDKIIKDFSVSWNKQNFTFKDLCSKTKLGKCQRNEVLSLKGKINDIKRKKIFLKYPYEIDDKSKRASFSCVGLGGVRVDEKNNILDAKALRLIYMLDYTKPERSEVNLKWEESFLEELSKVTSDYVKISRETDISLDNELNRLTEMAAPLLAATVFFMVGFAVLSSMTANWVTSKPWVAIAGCISPVLGVVASFGLLILCGVPYIDINIAVIFILVGIGLDDSFVILAAWRRTDPTQEVTERMRQTYSEAAVSITITSVTNVLSVFVGFGSPYRITKIYCIYASLSMFLAYVTQITFFGGALALSGIREKKNLHSVLFIPVKKEKVPDSVILKLLYVGLTDTEGDHKTHHFLSSRTERLLRIIVTPCGRLAILFCFILYLASSIYCLKFIQEGFKYKEAAPRHSYLVNYLETHYKYFTKYPHPLHIVINKTLDYSNKKVQQDIEDTIRLFSSGPNMAGENITISWLKYYLHSIENDVMSFSYRGYNMSDPAEFVAGLKNVFLRFPYSKEFRPHIKFNQNGTEIVASRFIVVSKNINTSFLEAEFVKTVFNKADAIDYPIYVYNFWFPIYSILLPVGASCFQTLCTAIGIVTLVFFLFIPNIFCAISILFTIASILVGVVGFMSWWNVTIDPVSMVALMISVGLSIDYAAHISYAYLSCKETSPNNKTVIALQAAGYPIIQGCLSTMLGVSVIAFGPSNMFLVFFKVIILVMLIALFHGLVIIPVALNSFETVCSKLAKRTNKTLIVENE